MVRFCYQKHFFIHDWPLSPYLDHPPFAEHELYNAMTKKMPVLSQKVFHYQIFYLSGYQFPNPFKKLKTELKQILAMVMYSHLAFYLFFFSSVSEWKVSAMVNDTCFFFWRNVPLLEFQLPLLLFKLIKWKKRGVSGHWVVLNMQWNNIILLSGWTSGSAGEKIFWELYPLGLVFISMIQYRSIFQNREKGPQAIDKGIWQLGGLLLPCFFARQKTLMVKEQYSGSRLRDPRSLLLDYFTRKKKTLMVNEQTSGTIIECPRNLLLVFSQGKKPWS